MKNPRTNSNGDKFWLNDKEQYHREDGPALEYSNGGKWWYYNGELIGTSWYGFTQEDFERYLKIKEYW